MEETFRIADDLLAELRRRARSKGDACSALSCAQLVLAAMDEGAFIKPGSPSHLDANNPRAKTMFNPTGDPKLGESRLQAQSSTQLDR
jgi:hypothetical protein